MMNRIRTVQVHARRLVPAEVELVFIVTLERLDSATQVTGKLVGPRCPYATTVEVAYPARQTHQSDEEDGPRVFMKVIIPEASFWEPMTPFLYEGSIDLWQGAQRCDSAPIRRGLRILSLGRQGLRLNGKIINLQAVLRDELQEAQATELRNAGTNSLIVPVSEQTASSVWEIADRLGFLVLGRINVLEQLAVAWSLREHPSVLGWVLEPDVLLNEAVRDMVCVYPADEGQLLGIHLTEKPVGPLPDGVSLVLCSQKAAASLPGLKLPKMIVHEDTKRATGIIVEQP